MQSAVLLAAGASIVAATHPALERLEKRDAKECSSVLLEILPDITSSPSPDSSLARFIATQTQDTSVDYACDILTITGSFAAEYTSYVSSVLSWFDKQKEAVSVLFEACSDVPDAMEQLGIASQYAHMCDGDDDNGAGFTSIKAGIALAVAGIAGVIML
ncbi:hypothetical protein ACJZ2D_016815 [Fusarium nematophilum]